MATLRLLRMIYYSLFMRLIIYLKTGQYCKRLFCYGGLAHIVANGRLVLPATEKINFVNSSKAATLGNARPCKLNVYENAELIFKGSFGISNVVIVATKSITIGRNVMIGGGVTIVDSDFHSMNPLDWFTGGDEKNMISAPVIIEDNVFIGMNSIILKGVTIGNDSVIAAGSVVTKDIPSGEVWGGNPARYIKKRI